ncbi:hypothetical protein EYE35_03145 [Cereibacter sphaeroides]|nr:hypothetical protein EYE35_03145 [Cereibacter sphaeroides]
MFIFPPFSKIFIKYVSSRQTDTRLGNLSAVDLLGPRNDADSESVRLHKALARHLKKFGLRGSSSISHRKREFTLYCQRRLSDPQLFNTMAGREEAAAQRKHISGYAIMLLPCDLDENGDLPDCCESILSLLDHAEDIALSARAGCLSASGYARYPWLFLGSQILPKAGEPEATAIERRVACDVVLFLWTIALIAGHGSRFECLMEDLIPCRANEIGQTWIDNLYGVTRICSGSPDVRRGPRPVYAFIANFLSEADPHCRGSESLSQELGRIKNGKVRLTPRTIDRQIRGLRLAGQQRCGNNKERDIQIQDLCEILKVHGYLLGLIQYAKDVALADLRQEYPLAQIDAAFDKGLSCWPKIVQHQLFMR